MIYYHKNFLNKLNKKKRKKIKKIKKSIIFVLLPTNESRFIICIFLKIIQNLIY